MFRGNQSVRTVSIVIPVFNEEHGLRQTLKEIPRKELQNMNYDYEVIVVDGNSVDSTREVAEKFGAKVILESRHGYGLAYKRGFSAAAGEIIATLDGDFSYSPLFIPKLLSVLEKENLDFISANRFGHIGDGAMSRLHRLGTRLLNLTISLLFLVNLKDSQSGMWIFRKATLQKMVLHANGMPFSEEFKIRAFSKFKSREIPIAYRGRIGRPKLNTFRDGFRNILHLFRLRFLRKASEV